MTGWLVTRPVWRLHPCLGDLRGPPSPQGDVRQWNLDPQSQQAIIVLILVIVIVIVIVVIVLFILLGADGEPVGDISEEDGAGPSQPGSQLVHEGRLLLLPEPEVAAKEGLGEGGGGEGGEEEEVLHGWGVVGDCGVRWGWREEETSGDHRDPSHPPMG